MIDELNQAIVGYQQKWQVLLEKRRDKTFFEGQKPTAIAWKVQDIEDLNRKFEELRELCDQIHFGWVNERWLTTMHLKDTKLEGGIEVIKLMQRRPDSKDPVGIDHLDFYSTRNDTAPAVLKDEPDLKWTHETSNAHCSWFSLWFADTEAKLRSDTVLDPCIAELQEARDAVLGA